MTYSFSSSANRGAVAILGGAGKQQTVVRSNAFRKYMANNHHLWSLFAHSRDYDVQDSDILFSSTAG